MAQKTIVAVRGPRLRRCLCRTARRAVTLGGVLAMLACLLAASPSEAVSVPPGFVVENAFPGYAFTRPVQVLYLPDGRKFVVEKTGRIWVMLPNGTRLATPFLDILPEVFDRYDLGLMGAALDPDFATNGWVYLTYTVDRDYPNTTHQKEDTFSRLTRYKASLADPNVADLSTREVLMGATWSEGIPSLARSHTVGCIRFAADKTLLLSTGDGANYSFLDPGGFDADGFGPGKIDPDEDIGAFRALSLNSLCGKILRVDKETGLGLPSNPFWDGDPASDRSRIYAYGMRNPYRFSIRPGSGDPDPSLGLPGSLYMGNTGWFAYEELEVATVPGVSFGWPCKEANDNSAYQGVASLPTGNTNVLCSAAPNAENPSTPVGPTLWWHHTNPGLSNPMGWTGDTSIMGDFYTASSFPLSYQGCFFIADWEENWIHWVKVDGSDNVVATGDFVLDGNGPVDMTVDPATGDLLYVAIKAGEIRRIRYLGDQVVPVTGGACVSPSTPCVTIPFELTGLTSQEARSASVTIQLNGGLVLCGSGIQQGSWLDGFGSSFFVVDNGGGSYTIDQAILGATCGVAEGGTLFTLEVTGATEGLANVTVTNAILRGCANEALPVMAGAVGQIPVDSTGPAAIADLGTLQAESGNGTDGTTRIAVTFSAPGDAATVEVYRAGFGNYPEYDDAPGSGSVPAVPAYPPAAPWTLTPATASGAFDDPPSRDFWYYVAFTKDACGNVSAVSNLTAGALNYHLGDVSDGISPCAGNNSVGTGDVSLLGSHYGETLDPSDPFACLDVGPTTDQSLGARPTTDNALDFEDLILFAINFGAVSKPGEVLANAPAGENSLAIESAATGAETGTVEAVLSMTGAGDVQGLSVRLGWNPEAVEPIAFEAGAWFEGHGGVLLSPRPGVLDAAILGAAARGLFGQGDLARVRFRVVGPGDPGIRVVELRARDRQNRPVEFGERPQAEEAPVFATGLQPIAPNPVRTNATLQFTLAQRGTVELSVYSVGGRHVRTLFRGEADPGVHTIRWSGTDDEGRSLPVGVYFVQLATPGGRFTRPMVWMR